MLEEFMKIFISWSGVISQQVANALCDWIPDVIQTTEPWMSTDIEAGARWNRVIQDKLGDVRFGIICLTKDNYNAPWILFEAGALAKTLEDTYVCPYLVDLEPSDLPPGPLTQFQAKQATKENTWELVQTINKAMGEALPNDKLSRAFERWWPDLKSTLDQLPESQNKVEAKRKPDDMLEEILVMVRDLTRRLPTIEVTKFDLARRIIEVLQKAGIELPHDEITLNIAESLNLTPPTVNELIEEIEEKRLAEEELPF
jgi:hypothetical protein